MSDPAPAPTSPSATVATSDQLKHLLALIEELPDLASQAAAFVAALKAHNLAEALGKLEAAISDLRTILA